MEAETEATANGASAIGAALKTTSGIVLILLMVWLVSIGYMASRLKVGWVPHDEGTLGLSAERVLQGQMPHRDFDDYTGGLTYLHALAFRIFGISSASMRYVLFAFFVPWVPAVFYIGSRFGSAISAGAVTLLAVAWSAPNYPGPMPSWYNLFFATWGVAALLRYLESESKWWLFAAGLCGGLSMLAKIAAAYYVAGVLLFFVFREQSLSRERETSAREIAWSYSTMVIVGLAMFVTLLFRMIRVRPGIEGPVYFVAPAVILSILLVARELRGTTVSEGKRFGRLAGMCAPFVAGLILPILLFAIEFARAGAARDLARGIAGAPVRAIEFASFDAHHPLTMLALIPFLLAIVVAYESGRVGRMICGLAVALYGAVILGFGGRSVLVYFLGWCALGTAIPMLVVAGSALLSSSKRPKIDETRQQQVMLLLSVTALCSLIQFPFSAPIYFFFVAPLVILSAMALFASFGRVPGPVMAAMIGIYLLFPNLPVTPYRMGISHALDGQKDRLSVPRAGGLRVDEADKSTYDQLVPLVQAHAGGGFAYAAPDCPEVYFLSGLQSPSRHYFDYADDPATRAEAITKKIKNLGIRVVVISKRAQFTGSLWPDVRNELNRRFEHWTDVGDFQVRWK